jgi:galactose mutarotase-like enzyme
MVSKATATLDWHYKGMRTLILENKPVRIVFLLDKGSDIIELRYKPMDLDLMWHSPRGYTNPREHVQSIPTSESSFTDLYGGGWQDAVPVIGDGPQENRGAKFGTHGESALLPWACEIEESEGDSALATMNAKGIRYPFRLEKKVRINKDDAKLFIRETLTNTSPQNLEFYWLQHPSFGEPFLSPGNKIDLPRGSEIDSIQEINPNGRVGGGKFAWPTVPARNGRSEIDLSVIPERKLVTEETIFVKMKEGWYMLTNPQLGLSFRLEWDVSVYPWLWFWQNYNLPDYPYYGGAWNIAIEPATSLPTSIAKQRKDDTCLKISGGSSVTTELTASIETHSS